MAQDMRFDWFNQCPRTTLHQDLDFTSMRAWRNELPFLTQFINLPDFFFHQACLHSHVDLIVVVVASANMIKIPVDQTLFFWLKMVGWVVRKGRFQLIKSFLRLLFYANGDDDEASHFVSATLLRLCKRHLWQSPTSTWMTRTVAAVSSKFENVLTGI